MGAGGFGSIFEGRPAWHAEAACLGEPVETFFPGPNAARDRLLRARQLCAGCPVRQECLDFALELGDGALGFWGGTDERERRRAGKSS
jgi:WhiB family redox-sensing transcriptional regulator